MVTVAVRLKGKDEAVWMLWLLQLLLLLFVVVAVVWLLLNKRNGDILAAVMVTLLLTRLRANEGAMSAQEPNVCLGMACEKKIDDDAVDDELVDDDDDDCVVEDSGGTRECGMILGAFEILSKLLGNVRADV